MKLKRFHIEKACKEFTNDKNSIVDFGEKGEGKKNLLI